MRHLKIAQYLIETVSYKVLLVIWEISRGPILSYRSLILNQGIENHKLQEKQHYEWIKHQILNHKFISMSLLQRIFK